MSRHFRNLKTGIEMRHVKYVLIVAFVFVSSFAEAQTLKERIAKVCPSRFAQLLEGKVDLPGNDEILHPVRLWMKENRRRLMGRKMSHVLGETVYVGGTETKIVEVLGKGAEGDIYLVQTPSGLRTLKTFNAPSSMEPQITQLKSNFPIPSPEIFERDPKTGRVLMEYIEGASVDHIASDWKAMGLTLQEKDAIMSQWRNENQRIESQSRSVPGFNVVYSFRTKKFYRVDASQ